MYPIEKFKKSEISFSIVSKYCAKWSVVPFLLQSFLNLKKYNKLPFIRDATHISVNLYVKVFINLYP